MSDLKKTPLSPTGEMPNDFYSWGDQTSSGIISKKEQMREELEEAFDSIEIEEDKETPELDYVLKVLGKDAGRVVIPFDMVVKDAYYDAEKKELVIIVRVGEGEEKEIRINVSDLIDIYTGDETTIHVENNVISITNEVMSKFDDLRKSIDAEKGYRKQGDDQLKADLIEEINNRKEAITNIEQEITEIKEMSDETYVKKDDFIPLDKIRALFDD